MIATDDDNNVQGYLMFGFSFIYFFNLWFLVRVLCYFILLLHGGQVDN
jgi:cytochrome c oxidase subunit 2